VALEHPTFMPPGISTLQPVLINNFWIHIHVPVIVASYAPLALAAVLANVWLVMRTFRPESCPQLREIARIQTWIVAPGVILLFAGLILGGIWADQSWGRFWGWDPKETWGLITMLVFVIVIHGRWVGWLRDFGVSIGNVLGGAALLFTYYGVNFFLSGLHSYAGAGDSAAGVSIWQKVPGWMWAYVVIQIVIVAAATIRSKAAGGGVASDGLGRA
jgi:ABC-type transport system involved in cytochrome c biogenesis permease subunit